METELPLNNAPVLNEQETTSSGSGAYPRSRWYWLRRLSSRLGHLLVSFYCVAASIGILVWASILLYYLNNLGLQEFGRQAVLFYSLVLFGFALPFYIVTVAVPFARRHGSLAESRLDNEINSAALNSDSSRTMIRALRRRARGLQLASWFSLFLTFIAIALGLYLFTIAGSIATRDYEGRSLLAQQYEIRFQEEVSSGLDRLNRIASRQEDASSLGYDRVGNRPRLSEEVANLTKNIDERANVINASIEKLNESQEKGNVALYLLISTISTRLGSVLLLIFLVQILLSVYRYSVRLQGYYDARADALLIANKTDAVELQQIIAVLSPEGINFGKMPTSPSEHVFNTIRGAVSTAKTIKS